MRYSTDQFLKSIEPIIIVSKVVRRHSPAAVCQAVEGSRPETTVLRLRMCDTDESIL